MELAGSSELVYRRDGKSVDDNPYTELKGALSSYTDGHGGLMGRGDRISLY